MSPGIDWLPVALLNVYLGWLMWRERSRARMAVLAIEEPDE